ncbi:MAG: DUF4838 domain-containing protein, partial [Actinobacteria bacterium]|nr:DUF4838 domain-containing protein [Actinomycetota bacterium]
MEAYVDNVVQYLDQRPEIDVFDAWPPDGAQWPSGAEERFGSIANAHAHVTNQLHAAVEAAGLDVRIEAIAYASHIDPPDPSQMFEPSTIIDFAPYDRSYTTPIYDDTYPRNVFYDELITQWGQEYSGPLAFYEYYRKYSWHSLPVVLPTLIGQEMPYFHSRGISGFGIYSEPADWVTYELTHLLVAELSWDVGIDSDAWLRGYLDE